ncbi:uncharacterized protein G2W53_003575 [Senna tora]|uniref:Uncharacterized protein n=1 Tax=Senna tora TaxID=362788 RepID=A0A835CJD8_9FABA|nr:uncharacterized protein G2W53_003575 [Senna tora]
MWSNNVDMERHPWVPSETPTILTPPPNNTTLEVEKVCDLLTVNGEAWG